MAVDVRAPLAAFRSERFFRVDGKLVHDRSALFGFYRTGDARWIQLHTNFPHHQAGILRFLGCDGTRASVASAVERWKAEDLEEVLVTAGCCAGMVGSTAEWQAHAQGRAVATLPLFEIVKVGDSPPEPCGRASRPRHTTPAMPTDGAGDRCSSRARTYPACRHS